MQVMEFGFAGSHELFANADRKGQVREMDSVYVADFAPANSKEDDPARMTFHYDVRPGSHFALNSCGNRVRHCGVNHTRFVLYVPFGANFPR